MHATTSFLLPSSLVLFLLCGRLGSVDARAYCNLKSPQAVFSTGGGTSPSGSGGGGGGSGGGGSGGGGTGSGGGDGGGSGSGGGGVCAEDRVFSTWYAGWHADEFPPDKVSWDKYTHVTYSFATTTDNSWDPLSLADSDAKLLPTFVSEAHKSGVKAILSLGGWGGSQFFSTAMGSAQNRTRFVQELLEIVSEYDLDGVDFDWEYPGRQGEGDNTVSSSDASNFLTTLRLLRTAPLAANMTVSAAVSLTPFAGSDGSPMDDVSKFAEVLDYIEIMNYDVWGTWLDAGPGPNAPLNDTCTTDGQGSAVSALAAWTRAQFPAEQIVLGVASYGRSYNVTPTSAELTQAKSAGEGVVRCPTFDKDVASQMGSGDSNGWDGNDGGEDQCGGSIPVDGIWDFWGLITGGLLDGNGTAAEGMLYTFDNCSQTPYIYSPASWVQVSYDDARSFDAKGQFIAEQGLLGFAMWEAGGDYNDILLDSIRTAIVTRETC
ncbi:glycoside hydrolase [Punctularia strigosozonata HHB-11173 SS5]|uniref:glycoside hydrolase n=1 Tax=Punctularia strigosozonata (strain HHB-11173) TaxID=741275 RepID=UPI0004416283|nr:glycoside hydrolase [Punctularia strigosozonata HHB-11173 SS5]EIN09004.1 glycoside hydrolase [Punctularia strigosozonata HHB-11173 SS5]